MSPDEIENKLREMLAPLNLKFRWEDGTTLTLVSTDHAGRADVRCVGDRDLFSDPEYFDNVVHHIKEHFRRT